MMSHHVRNTSFWQEFFQLYRSMPELWLTNSKDYRNRKLKAQSYDRLLQHMRQSDPASNIHMLKRKINNLRTSYRRELRKVLDSRAFQNDQEEYIPSLWYFNELDFLYEQETAEEAHLQQELPLPESEYLKERVQLTDVEDIVEVTVDEEPDDDDADEDIFAEPFPPEEDMLVIEAEGDHEVDVPGAEIVVEAEPETRHKNKYQPHSSKHSLSYPHPHPHSHSHPFATSQTQQQQQQQQRRSVGTVTVQSTRCRRRLSIYGDNDADADGSYEDTPAATSAATKKRRLIDQMVSHTVEQAENECDLIGKRMAAHFRNMRPDQRLFAERIISEVLLYGRMNRLSLDARFLPNVNGLDAAEDVYARDDGK